MSNVSRRHFLQAGGLFGGTALIGGLAACTPQAGTNDDESSLSDTGLDGGAAQGDAPFSKPDPIDESLITSTEEADIVVVGIGTAGLTCAVKAGHR